MKIHKYRNIRYLCFNNIKKNLYISILKHHIYIEIINHISCSITSIF